MPSPLQRATFTHDLIVVGAGVIGASVAWHAAKAGRRVAVVDAIGPAAGASGACDGAVSVASKRPGVLAELAAISLAYCHELGVPGGVLQGVFTQRPSYFFAEDAQEAHALDDLGEKLAALGTLVRVQHDVAQPQRLLHDVGPTVCRLMEIAGEGHMMGYAATLAYLAHKRIEPHWPVAVQAIEVRDVGVHVRAPGAALSAPQAVIASGLGSQTLVPHLPVLPRAGQLLITDAARHNTRDRLPGALTAASYLLNKQACQPVSSDASLLPVVIDPLGTGQLLIGSTREPHGDARHHDSAVLIAMLQRASRIYPPLLRRRVLRAFTGVRCAVEDGLPIVGLLPDHTNVWVATGFEGDGICLAAAVGQALAAAMDGQVAHPHWASLSPQRFITRDTRHVGSTVLAG